MPNHIHLIAVPGKKEDLRLAIGEDYHRRYTRRINFREGWRGHLWQERFSSFLNVSDPANPFEAGFYDTPSLAYGVYVSDGYAYIADCDAGLQIYEFYTIGIKETSSYAILKPNLLNNPVRGEIRLEIGERKEPIKFSLYNTLGERVKTYWVDGQESRINLSVKGLATGIYFLKTEEKTTSPMIKVVIVE